MGMTVSGVRSWSSIISETIDMIYSRYEKTILYLQTGLVGAVGKQYG